MKKVLLLLFFFLLDGCSLNSILALGEVNKTQVVKKSYYVKHYRAYFTRNALKPIIKNKKYLYFYNAKTKDLSVLLHKRNQYILYSLFHPSKKSIVINTYQKNAYHYAVKRLKQKGYYLTSPAKIGCTSHVALRKYKGIKTLLVEIKDYSRLQKIYKQAIKTYNVKKVKNIKTKLPKHLIVSYYNSHSKYAKTEKQRNALYKIGVKLQLRVKKHTNATIIKKTSSKSNSQKNVPIKKEEKEIEIEEEQIIEKIKEEDLEDTKNIEILNEPIHEREKPFNYYLHNASYDELNTYISSGKAKENLRDDQYIELTQKRTKLKEERLLKYGSLEELIAAYKKNKKPLYKQRILTLMKKVQEHK